MATTVYSEMERLLGRLCEIYIEIHQCLHQERAALTAFDFEKLPELNQRKENLCYEVQRLEQWRESLFDDLSVQYQISDKPLKLKALIPRLPEDYRVSIEKLTQELEARSEACLDLFRSNQQFIDQSLKNIEQLRENYQSQLGSAAGTTTYSKSGKVESASMPLVRKKV